MERGRKPSERSLDMAYVEGEILACRRCRQIICRCARTEVQLLDREIVRLRRENQRDSGTNEEAA